MLCRFPSRGSHWWPRGETRGRRKRNSFVLGSFDWADSGGVRAQMKCRHGHVSPLAYQISQKMSACGGGDTLEATSLGKIVPVGRQTYGNSRKSSAKSKRGEKKRKVQYENPIKHRRTSSARMVRPLRTRMCTVCYPRSVALPIGGGSQTRCGNQYAPCAVPGTLLYSIILCVKKKAQASKNGQRVALWAFFFFLQSSLSFAPCHVHRTRPLSAVNYFLFYYGDSLDRLAAHTRRPLSALLRTKTRIG